MIRFCGQPCYHAWRKAEGVTTGQFRKGSEPWNAGLRGFRPSRRTEFKKGRASDNKMSVGTVQIRIDKQKRERAWVKVADPKEWWPRATWVWQQAYGELPKGLVIHHVDRDTLNDALTNLAAISRAAHLNIHKVEIHGGRLP